MNKVPFLSSGLNDLHGCHPFISRLIFCTGLVLWLVVQSALVGIPLWSRTLPPEVDDAYTYMIKSVQMESCFLQDCPSLEDLRPQLSMPSSDPQIAWQRYRAYSGSFLVYHPLYSVILLGLKKLGFSWEIAYKVIGSLGPLFFGLVFAYWLHTLWGIAPAGIALGLLAFQVFPGQGLHYVVPSNLALGVAVFVWARIIARCGDSPWSMVIGTVALVAMHPIGRIYAGMAASLAMVMVGIPRARKAWLPFLATGMVVGIAFLLSAVVQRPELSITPEPYSSFSVLAILYYSVKNVAHAIDSWLAPLGSIAIIGGLISVGYLTAELNRQKVLAKTTFIIASFLLLSLLYVLPHAPAELFLRLWIPFAVLLTGAMGQAIWYALEQTGRLLSIGWMNPSEPSNIQVGLWKLSPHAWAIVPLIVLMVLVGFSFQVVGHGVDAVRSMITFSRDRHSMLLDPEQPAILLSRARPGDRVLYIHDILMLFYFTHGAMQVGAVYYPGIAGTPEENQWIQRSDLRFAVVWNPVQSFSVSRDGKIPVSSLSWLRFQITEPAVSKYLKVFVENRGGIAQVEVIPIDSTNNLLSGSKVGADIPARWSGWVNLDLSGASATNAFRISFPIGMPDLYIGGIVFGDDPLQWPWANRSTLTLMPKEKDAVPMTLSFDPETILPAPLSRMRVSILDDHGSSVLVRIER